MTGADIANTLRRASPRGRLAYLRERLDAGELRDERARAAIRAEVDELQAQIDAGAVPAPRKFMLRLALIERTYLQALADQVSATQAARRRGKPATLEKIDLHGADRNDDVRRRHAALVAAGRNDATSQTAREFGLSRSTIQRIVKDPAT